LDHAAPDAGVAGARKTSLAPASTALVRRAGKPGIAGDGFAIAQVAGEDLVDQHIRRLNTNTEDPCKEANHRVRTFPSSRGRRKLAQTFLLDRADLLAYDAQPSEVPAQLCERILQQQRPFRRAQIIELFFSPA
jgi:hypothetical protein